MNIAPSTSQQNIKNHLCKINKMYNIAGGTNNFYNKTSEENVKVEDIADNLPKPPKLISAFRGREEEIKQLDSYFFEQDKRMVTICGLPGFGKSELAKQFAQVCKEANKIKIVCWIQATTEDNLHQSFRDLANLLKLPDVEDIRNLIQMIINRFNGTQTMFIVDDAENRQSLKDFETPNGCYCLITSHENDWDDDIPSLKLAPLDSSAAVDVLRTILNTNRTVVTDEDLLYGLAIILECVPLALQLAAAYIREEEKELRDKFSLKEYIEELSQEDIVTQEVPKWSSLPYEKSIARAINISIKKIQDVNTVKSKLAIDILNMCPYLNCFLTMEQTILDIPYFQRMLEENKRNTLEKDIRKALSLLSNYSLIIFDYTVTSIQMHRLVKSTLIFYHKNSDNLYYFSCLEFILIDRSQIHLYTVLEHADYNFETFSKFYAIHKSDIILEDICFKFENKSVLTDIIQYWKYFATFLGALVVMRCKNCLAHIFDDLDNRAGKIIDNHLLSFIATTWSYSDLLQLMINYGANVNIKDPITKSTLLQLATGTLDLDSINILLENNANISDIDSNGNSALAYVFGGMNLKKHKIDDNFAFDIITTLINKGINIRVNKYGTTILHSAVIHNNKKLTELIIDKLKVDVNIKDFNGYTPLHFIPFIPHMKLNLFNFTPDTIKFDPFLNCIFGKEKLDTFMSPENLETEDISLDIMSTLVDNGADVNILCPDGYTVLHHAVLNKNLKLTEFIIDKLHVNINIKTANGLTPFDVIFSEFTSCNDEILNIMNALVDRGARLQQADVHLHLALTQNNIKVIKFLINNLHVDVNTISPFGLSPLDVVFQKEYKKFADKINSETDDTTLEILSLLYNNGAIFHVVDSNSYSILHHAVVLANMKLIEFIIDELHVDVNVQDNEGTTPLDLVTALSTTTNNINSNKEVTNKILSYLKSRGARVNTLSRTRKEELIKIFKILLFLLFFNLIWGNIELSLFWRIIYTTACIKFIDIVLLIIRRFMPK